MDEKKTPTGRPKRFTLWIAIDPGQSHSGMVAIRDPLNASRFIESAVEDVSNEDVVLWLKTNVPILRPEIIILEDMSATGVPCGHALLDTARWIGRLDAHASIAVAPYGGTVVLMPRHRVRTMLGVRDDSGSRQAVLSMFKPTGEGKDPQVGTKKKPGPLYGVTGHSWQAVAVAMAYLTEKTMRSAQHVRTKIEQGHTAADPIEVDDADNPFNSPGQGTEQKENE